MNSAGASDPGLGPASVSVPGKSPSPGSCRGSSGAAFTPSWSDLENPTSASAGTTVGASATNVMTTPAINRRTTGIKDLRTLWAAHRPPASASEGTRHAGDDAPTTRVHALFQPRLRADPSRRSFGQNAW